jgi:hypothetical protein
MGDDDDVGAARMTLFDSLRTSSTSVVPGDAGELDRAPTG